MSFWKNAKIVAKEKSSLHDGSAQIPFGDGLMNDTVKLLKKNGDEVPDIKAAVTPGKIHILRSDISIQADDIIQREMMSNGDEETYRVVNPVFHEGLGEIQAFYSIDVVKLGLPEAETAVQNITYNISGANSRVNQGSTDNSTNIVNLNPEINKQIKALRNEIEKLDSPKEKETSYEAIDAVEAQISSENPSKAVVETLLSNLPNAGSIASIGSLIVSLLKG